MGASKPSVRAVMKASRPSVRGVIIPVVQIQVQNRVLEVCSPLPEEPIVLVEENQLLGLVVIQPCS